jgi:hypothetical protein
MKARKYKYNMIIRDCSRYGFAMFELLTDRELSKCNVTLVTKPVRVDRGRIYFLFGSRFCSFASASEVNDEIRAYALQILKKYGLTPQDLTPELRASLCRSVYSDLGPIPNDASDTKEIILNVVKNL